MTRPDKKRLIMQAAEQLFTRRRFHEITMEDVARAAGVGKGTIYGYFRTKDDLFFETATAGFDELYERIQRHAPEEGAFREILLWICREIHDFFLRRRPLFRMMQTEQFRALWQRGRLRERMLEQRGKLVAAVAGVFRAGVAAGEIRGDLDPEVLAHLFLGMQRTRVMDLADGPAAPPSHEFIVDLFCQGAGAARGEALADAGPRASDSFGRTLL